MHGGLFHAGLPAASGGMQEAGQGGLYDPIQQCFSYVKVAPGIFFSPPFLPTRTSYTPFHPGLFMLKKVGVLDGIAAVLMFLREGLRRRLPLFKGFGLPSVRRG